MSSREVKSDQLSATDVYQLIHENLSAQLRAGMGFLVPVEEAEEGGLEIAALLALLESFLPGGVEGSESSAPDSIVRERNELAARVEALETELASQQARCKELEAELGSREEDSGGTAAGSEVKGRLAIRQYKSIEFEFGLNSHECTIGRTSINDLQFKDPSVSRKHAILKWHKGVAEIIDCDSRNGVFVNDIKVSRSELCHGDMVMVGTQRFVFVAR